VPEAKLPTSWKGWLLALLVGFVSGFLTIRPLGPKLA